MKTAFLFFVCDVKYFVNMWQFTINR